MGFRVCQICFLLLIIWACGFSLAHQSDALTEIKRLNQSCISGLDPELVVVEFDVLAFCEKKKKCSCILGDIGLFFFAIMFLVLTLG